MNLNQKPPNPTPEEPRNADAREQVLELTLDELSYVAGAYHIIKL